MEMFGDNYKYEFKFEFQVKLSVAIGSTSRIEIWLCLRIRSNAKPFSKSLLRNTVIYWLNWQGSQKEGENIDAFKLEVMNIEIIHDEFFNSGVSSMVPTGTWSPAGLFWK